MPLVLSLTIAKTHHAHLHLLLYQVKLQDFSLVFSCFPSKAAYLARFVCYSVPNSKGRSTMRAPESRLERIEQIERKLAQRPEGWTTGELAHEFQVDPSTIFRDLAVLESMGTGLFTTGRRY